MNGTHVVCAAGLRQRPGLDSMRRRLLSLRGCRVAPIFPDENWVSFIGPDRERDSVVHLLASLGYPEVPSSRGLSR